MLHASEAVVTEEPGPPDEVMVTGHLKNSEALQSLDSTLAHLAPQLCVELIALIKEFPGIFGDTPTQTHLLEHDIDVGNTEPIKQHYYWVPLDRRQCLDKTL